MSIREPNCRAFVALTSTESAQMSAVPYPAHEVQKHYECELGPDHAGRHVSVVQDDDDGLTVTTWWVWWSDDHQHELLPDATCPEAIDDDTGCLLPKGHVGKHR